MSDKYLVEDARRELSAMRAYVRRTGITGWTSRSAAGYYCKAFAAVVRVEDAHGADVAGPLSDRLRGLYAEARAAGLLTADDIIAMERKAIARVDSEANNAR